jgi:hypothetical protein
LTGELTGVARQIALQALVGGTDGFIRMQIDLLVCDTFPQPLDKHVIPPAAFPLPADLDPWAFSRPVNSWLVNWQPCSVLKISGVP